MKATLMSETALEQKLLQLDAINITEPRLTVDSAMEFYSRCVHGHIHAFPLSEKDKSQDCIYCDP